MSISSGQILCADDCCCYFHCMFESKSWVKCMLFVKFDVISHVVKFYATYAMNIKILSHASFIVF